MLVRVFSQMPRVIVGVRREPGYRIKFMISHDRQCGALINHRANNFQYTPLIRAAVDEVTEKNDLPIRVAMHAVRLPIAEPAQQLDQRLAVTVNITDEVVLH